MGKHKGINKKRFFSSLKKKHVIVSIIVLLVFCILFYGSPRALIGLVINDGAQIQLTKDAVFMDVEEGYRYVIIDLQGDRYGVSFTINDEEVIVNLLNDEFVLLKDNVLPIELKNGYVFIGIDEISGNSARLVFGTDAEVVREGIGNFIDGG